MFISGVLKLHTSIFLIYFEFLKLYFRNHFWKFILQFLANFLANVIIFILWISFRIKIILLLKSLRTTGLDWDLFVTTGQCYQRYVAPIISIWWFDNVKVVYKKGPFSRQNNMNGQLWRGICLIFFWTSKNILRDLKHALSS